MASSDPLRCFQGNKTAPESFQGFYHDFEFVVSFSTSQGRSKVEVKVFQAAALRPFHLPR